MIDMILNSWSNVDAEFASLWLWAIQQQFAPVVIGLISTLISCVLYDVVKELRKKTPAEVRERRSKMTKRARERWVRRHAAAIFTLSIEDSRYKGKLTNEECEWLYQQLGSRLHLLDVLPRGPWPSWRPDTEALKEKLKERRNEKEIFDPMSIRKV